MLALMVFSLNCVDYLQNEVCVVFVFVVAVVVAELEVVVAKYSAGSVR